MKEKILEHVKQNLNSTHHTVAKAFSISEMDAIRTLHELHNEGKIRVKSLPLENRIDKNCSVFYF